MGASVGSRDAVARMRRWSSAVRPGWQPDDSRTAPTRRTGSVSWSYRFPPNVAVPLLGAARPRSIRRVVVLPAPLGPSRAVTSPGSATALTSSTASTSAYDLVRSRSSTAHGKAPVTASALVRRTADVWSARRRRTFDLRELALVSRPAHRDGAGQGEGDEQGARQGGEPGAVRRGGAEVRVGLGGEPGDGDGGEGDGAGHDPRPDRAAARHRVPADHREQREGEGGRVDASGQDQRGDTQHERSEDEQPVLVAGSTLVLGPAQAFPIPPALRQLALPIRRWPPRPAALPRFRSMPPRTGEFSPPFSRRCREFPPVARESCPPISRSKSRHAIPAFQLSSAPRRPAPSRMCREK